MHSQGVSKRAFQWYSECCSVASVERWIASTPLSVNLFVSLATQKLENHCKALFETPCITCGSHIEP
jgi:hypothetical protein